MLTTDALQELGVNVKEGLGRCLNNEGFYLRMVNKALDDEENFRRLSAAVAAGDKAAAFEAAHALKGVAGNLSLTPLYEPLSEMTELLRVGAAADYDALLARALASFEQMKALREA